jgi:hypothetical protein
MMANHSDAISSDGLCDKMNIGRTLTLVLKTTQLSKSMQKYVPLTEQKQVKYIADRWS